MSPKYDGLKYYRICDNTLDNYAQMLKRLKRRKGFTSFILIYYSVLLIILPLTTIYFPKCLNKTIVDYSSIAISICILACSLTIQNVKYPERIMSATKVINSLNKIKREIYNLQDKDLEEKVKCYYSITDTAEQRSDIDFFKNLYHNSKLYDIGIFKKVLHENGEEKLKKLNSDEKEKAETAIQSIIEHLHEINVYTQILYCIFEYVIYFIIIALPITVLVLAIIFKDTVFN